MASCRILRENMISFVPDGGHKRLIELCRGDAAMRTVTLTTEEEGVAFAAFEERGEALLQVFDFVCDSLPV